MPSRSRKSSSATACSGSGPLRRAPLRLLAGGFTLLEVIIALAILGIGLGVIFQGLGFSLRLRGEATQSVRLAVAAERVLGGLPARRAAPKEAEEGELDGVSWRLEPLARRAEPLGGPPRPLGAELVEVRLTLSVPSGRTLEMTTLLPAGKPEAAP
jgi:prepilin-type N-terminal cleavage/methylation domain-containing protein